MNDVSVLCDENEIRVREHGFSGNRKLIVRKRGTTWIQVENSLLVGHRSRSFLRWLLKKTDTSPFFSLSLEAPVPPPSVFLLLHLPRKMMACYIASGHGSLPPLFPSLSLFLRTARVWTTTLEKDEGKKIRGVGRREREELGREPRMMDSERHEREKERKRETEGERGDRWLPW